MIKEIKQIGLFDERYQRPKKNKQIKLIQNNQTLIKRNHIENPQKLNMRNIQEPREDENIEDTDTELEHGPQKNLKIRKIRN